MSFEDIKLLIDELPKYIQYIYPGYITIYLYYFFRGITLKDAKNIIVKSIGLSFIYILCLNELLKAEYASLPYNVWLIILGASVAYVSYMLVESTSFLESLSGIYISTSTKLNEIDAMRDPEHEDRAWLKVYLKHDNIAYEGSLCKHESEMDKKCFVMLSGYTKYRIGKDKKEEILADFQFKNKETVTIYSGDIKFIESADIARIKAINKKRKQESAASENK